MGRLTVEKAAVPRVTGKTETDYMYREISGGTVETNYTYSISVRQQSTEQGYRPYEPTSDYDKVDVRGLTYYDVGNHTTQSIDFVDCTWANPTDVFGTVYRNISTVKLQYSNGDTAVSDSWSSSDEDFPELELDPRFEERLGFYIGPVEKFTPKTKTHQSDRWESTCIRDNNENTPKCYVADAIESVDLQWKGIGAVVYQGHDPYNPTMPLLAYVKDLDDYWAYQVNTNLLPIYEDCIPMSYTIKNFEITVSET